VIRSIGAIVAGLAFTIVVTTLVDLALHAAGVYSMQQPLTDNLAVLAASYRIVISIAGAWITARMAPDKPMKHALILGVIGTVLGAMGAAATWNKDMGPHWYPVALAVLAIPQCWAGGKLYEMRRT
jgi:uncharacterized membrane protein